MDPTSGEIKSIATFPLQNVLAISHDGDMAITTSGIELTIRQVNDRKILAEYSLAPITIEIYRELGHELAFFTAAFQSDDQMALIGGSKVCWLWHAGQPLIDHQCDMETRQVLFSPDQNTFALLVEDSLSVVSPKFVRIGTLIDNDWMRFPIFDGGYRIDKMTFSPDGTWLATVSSHVLIWNLRTGQLDHTIEITSGNKVTSLAFSPDQALLALGDAAGYITFYDTATFHKLSSLDAHRGAVDWLTFSQDGSLLASAGADGTVSTWGLP